MIYKNLALTAAHCIYGIENGGATSVMIWPGRNGSSKSFGSASVSGIIVDQKYYNSQSIDEDWALLTLSTNIGNNCGWSGIAYSEDYSYFANGEQVTVIGYPDEKGIYQYSARDYVRYAFPMHLAYQVDITDGQSGGPVYDDAGYVIGITTKELEVYGEQLNWCDNITKSRFETFASKMN